jgi:hypothetical protein
LELAELQEMLCRSNRHPVTFCRERLDRFAYFLSKIWLLSCFQVVRSPKPAPLALIVVDPMRPVALHRFCVAAVASTGAIMVVNSHSR